MVMMPDTFPFMVIGNKLDLADENRQVSYNTGARFCSENGGMTFLETSAKENKNVEQAFLLLSKQALLRQEEMSKKIDDH